MKRLTVRRIMWVALLVQTIIMFKLQWDSNHLRHRLINEIIENLDYRNE